MMKTENVAEKFFEAVCCHACQTGQDESRVWEAIKE